MAIPKEAKLLLKWGNNADGTVKTKELHCNVEALATAALFGAQILIQVLDVLSTNNAQVLARYPEYAAASTLFNFIPIESIVSVKFLEDPGW